RFDFDRGDVRAKARLRRRVLDLLVAIARLADRLRAELHETDARRVLRALHELRDAFDADRVTDADRHAENFFGELRHSFEEDRAAREDRAGGELLEQTGVFDALADRGEHFFDARLDDVAQNATRGASRRVSADAGNLDLFFVADEATERAAREALDAI